MIWRPHRCPVRGELGTMRVTEQIDALETLGRSPRANLIIPRVLAGSLMIPVLTIVADVTGVVSGWLASAGAPVTTHDSLRCPDLLASVRRLYSVIKGFAFAICITIVSCYCASAPSRPEGVGKATRARWWRAA